jgi:hypothetical protein
MSVMNEMPYRRSKREHDATGSLVFDQERNKHRDTGEMPQHTVHPHYGRARGD